jgi:hypothetical protein
VKREQINPAAIQVTSLSSCRDKRKYESGRSTLLRIIKFADLGLADWHSYEICGLIIKNENL